MTFKTLDQSSSRVLPTSVTQVATQHSTRSDSDMAAEVRRVLQADTVLRATADRIDARVNAGVATLRGYVASDAHKARAESDVRQIPGVQVENHVIADPDLEALVAQKIAQDARLCTNPIFVHSTIGVIRLDGQVDRADLADAADRCVASVPNVRAVVNYIQSPGAANRQPERVLLPEIGQAVYASDGLLGQIKCVVLNPNNRRVMAIVVDAHFYTLALAMECRILIPITTVRNVNTSGIELALTLSEAEHCPDFDPTKFVVPESDWQLPLDYDRNDVLLESTRDLLT